MKLAIKIIVILILEVIGTILLNTYLVNPKWLYWTLETLTIIGSMILISILILLEVLERRFVPWIKDFGCSVWRIYTTGIEVMITYPLSPHIWESEIKARIG